MALLSSLARARDSLEWELSSLLRRSPSIRGSGKCERNPHLDIMASKQIARNSRRPTRGPVRGNL